MRTRVTTAAVAAVLLSGCATQRRGSDSPAAQADAARQAAERLADATTPGAGQLRSRSDDAGSTRIGRNDLLDVTVLEAPELNRAVRVAGTGTVSLPLVGEVTAAGLTTRELELAIEANLRRRYIRDPHVTVRLAEMQSNPVTVVGAVLRPGVFQLVEPRPLLEVIALAGGTAGNAGGTALIVRAPAPSAAAGGSPAAPEQIEVDLAAPFEGGRSGGQVLIRPGDMVQVRPAGLVYVVGEVRRPGAFPVGRPGLTVLQAIALGEGFGPKAARQRALIIRTSPTGERVELPTDLGAVLAGRAADTPLQPRDVVFVPSSTTKSVTLGVVDALVRMVTLRPAF